MSDQEKKDKKFSMIMTAGIHVGILLLLIFLVAWSPPDPPTPEYGIELNFGFQEEGGGDVEKESEAQAEDTEEVTPPDAEVEAEQVEAEQEVDLVEPDPKPVEVKEEATPVPVKTEQVEKEAPAEEVIEKPIVTPVESEVKVEEKKEEVVEEKKEEVVPPKKVEEEKKAEVKPQPQPKPKPTLDNRALMGGKKTNTDSKEATSNNQGKYPEKKGNQGDPEGNKETNGTNPGGEDIGVSYSLDGWKWERPPTDKDDSQIDGIIKFAIDVDDRGKVLTVSVVPGTTISDNTIVEFYKKQVLKLSFRQTDTSKAPAPISKGEVTFVIKTN